MIDPTLVAEADRQFAICNACRYCEGFCPVFPAAETRTEIAAHDLAYLSNLCHDCRMCYDACMFAPPHEFAVNVPQVLAAARVATYEGAGVPSAAARAFRRPRRAGIVAVAAGILVALAAVVTVGGFGALFTPQNGAGAFYRVLPWPAMTFPALALGLYALAVMAIGARRFARESRGGTSRAPAGAFRRALGEAVTLAYLRGGGVGCYDETRGSARRRLFHGFVFWGFIAAAISTTAAFVEQDVFGIVPPFDLLSVPVVTGTAGGLAIVIGGVGLALVKRRSDPRPQARASIALDIAFLWLLIAAAASGLALLAVRATPAMPVALAVHLGIIAGLFVAFPYGKFVHVVYRFIALVQHAQETARD